MKIPIFSTLTIVGLTAAIAFLLIPGDRIKAGEKRIFRCEKPKKQDFPRTYSLYEVEKRTILRWSGPLGEKILKSVVSKLLFGFNKPMTMTR